MGETDLHRDWMVRILEIFRQRYAGQRVYIASDLLVYYAEGTPSKFVVPDCFVVLDCDPQRRRTFQTWKELRVPDVVFDQMMSGLLSPLKSTLPGPPPPPEEKFATTVAFVASANVQAAPALLPPLQEAPLQLAKDAPGFGVAARVT